MAHISVPRKQVKLTSTNNTINQSILNLQPHQSRPTHRDRERKSTGPHRVKQTNTKMRSRPTSIHPSIQQQHLRALFLRTAFPRDRLLLSKRQILEAGWKRAGTVHPSPVLPSWAIYAPTKTKINVGGEGLVHLRRLPRGEEHRGIPIIA